MPPEVPPELGAIIPPPPDRPNRSYTPAVWAPAGGGSGHPKVSGGYETSDSSGRPCGRGLNRIDQRYTKPPATLTADRITRASAEYASTLILQLTSDKLQVITNNGNAYTLARSLDDCSCPDFWRLNQSYPGIGLLCKHIYMAQQAVDTIGMDNLAMSVGMITELTPLADRTVIQQIATGHLVGTIVINAYKVEVADFWAWWNVYRLKLIPPL